MRWLIDLYRNMRIGLKLNLATLGSVSIMAIVAILLIRVGNEQQSIQAGQQRAEEEVMVIRNRFVEAESNILIDAQQLASIPGFSEAVALEDISAVQEIVQTGIAPLNLDNIRIVNAEGASLNVLAEGIGPYESMLEGEDRLISLAQLGIDITGFLVSTEAEQTVSLAAATPLYDNSGSIVGALIISRKIDDAFLEEVNFERSSTHLFFLYQGVVLAKHVEKESLPVNTDSIELYKLLDPAAITSASDGHRIVGEELYHGFSHTYALAYTPIADTDSQAIVAVLVNMDQYLLLGQQLTQRLTITASLASLFVFGALAFIARRNISAPLSKLQAVSEHMASGDYVQRVDVTTKDEIGLLASAFNEMAAAVQKRNMDLQKLVQQLEEQTQNLQIAKTEAEIARARAEEADQLKSQFLASMSHELRTPLNAILNFSEAIALGMVGPVNEQQVDLINKSLDSGKHLLNLINDVLDIAKIQSGMLTLFIEDNINIYDILNTVTPVAEVLLQDKSVRLVQNIDENLPIISGDQRRIRQILLNLISNAAKFTEAGTITVSASRRDNKIRFTVTDTGPGIPEEQQEIIFEPFIQTEYGIKHAGGTGLGLAITKKLAEAHGGQIWVESKVGAGATFTVDLSVNNSHVKESKRGNDVKQDTLSVR